MKSPDSNNTLDLDAFEDVQTGVCALKHPATGAAFGATITLAGPEHPVRQRFLMDRTRRMRAAVRKSGKLDVTDPLDDREEETDYLVACTLGWSGLERGGMAVAFDAAAARQLYTDPKRQWLRSQVKAALDEAELFIGSSERA